MTTRKPKPECLWCRSLCAARAGAPILGAW
nr:MAG TPA: hypothetical protein [Caudoviricetes sp.]